MVGGDISAQAPWWAASSVVALWIMREVLTHLLSRRKERAETDANVELISGLSTRIQQLEARMGNQDTRLDQEIALRLEAQEQAAKLRLRIIVLESTLRRLGAVIPDEEAEAGK